MIVKNNSKFNVKNYFNVFLPARIILTLGKILTLTEHFNVRNYFD